MIIRRSSFIGAAIGLIAAALVIGAAVCAHMVSKVDFAWARPDERA